MKTIKIMTIFLGIVVLSCTSVKSTCAEKPTNIVFLTWKPNQPEVWDTVIENFHQKNPDIHIKVQVGPHSSTQYHAIVAQRLKNMDKSVDVFFMDVIWPPEFANAGWALDLSSKFSVEEQNKFLSGPIAANTYQGKIYGVPCYLGAGLFYYREDLLQKYHFKPPTLWEEMLEQGKVILKGENEQGLHIYSGQFKQYEGLVCNMMEFIWSNGGAVIGQKSGKAVLDNPAVVESLKFVRDKIIAKAAPRGVINYEEPESLDLFIQGKAIFHRNWPYAWAVANDPKKSKIAGKIGVGSLPAFHRHSSASTLGGWQFGINNYSMHAQEAWRFIQFMTSHETQKILALDAGLAPTRRSVYQDPEVQKKRAHLNAFLPAFENARPRPLSPVYPMISQELQRFFSQAITESGSDISEMAAASSARIEKFFVLGAMITK
jgi:multiple sugar transport system substrate-binding protein